MQILNKKKHICRTYILSYVLAFGYIENVWQGKRKKSLKISKLYEKKNKYEIDKKITRQKIGKQQAISSNVKNKNVEVKW